MCFPVAMALVSAGISAAGSVMGGAMAQQQAKAQKAAYDRQAQMTTMQGEYEAGRKQDEINQITGRQVALTGGSGVTLEGSPTAVIADTASQGALDIGAIRWGAKVKADTFNYEGQLAKIQGQNAMAGGIMGGIGSLVGGLGKAGATYLGNKFGTA